MKLKRIGKNMNRKSIIIIIENGNQVKYLLQLFQDLCVALVVLSFRGARRGTPVACVRTIDAV